MTRSMTGLARKETSGPWGRCTWELRSVNHRYLDLHMRLPDEFRALEPKVRRRVTARVGRGKLDCSLRFEYQKEGDAPLELDMKRLQRLADACASVSELVPEVGHVDPLRLLNWPGVVLEHTPELDELEGDVLALLEEALGELNEAREREGERLVGFVRERIDTLEKQVGQVRERLPQVREAWRARLEERLNQLQLEAEPGRLEQEMVIQANRMDVDEELDRLSAHAKALRSILDRSDPVGRRLDFVMQECNREANTIASKSQDGEVTRVALEMKVTIEQIREQVQNIE